MSKSQASKRKTPPPAPSTLEEKSRRLVLSALSYLASKGNKDALIAMDQVQEIASKRVEDLEPKLRAHVEAALKSAREKK